MRNEPLSKSEPLFVSEPRRRRHHITGAGRLAREHQVSGASHIREEHHESGANYAESTNVRERVNSSESTKLQEQPHPWKAPTEANEHTRTEHQYKERATPEESTKT
jgi:hypothetical protein